MITSLSPSLFPNWSRASPPPRAAPASPPPTTPLFGPFRLDTVKRRLFRDHVEIHITPNEYLLLRALTLHRGETVSRRQLAQAVWGAAAISHGALDTLVNSLRDKLNAQQPGLIVTVRGVGYSLADAPGAGPGSEP